VVTVHERIAALESKVLSLEKEVMAADERYQFLLTQISAMMHDHGWGK
jgi:hypothetical protein